MKSKKCPNPKCSIVIYGDVEYCVCGQKLSNGRLDESAFDMLQSMFIQDEAPDTEPFDK